ncbi:hairy and enhancer of split-related protein HELT [Fukomys damarensis]|uniref:hairy and enhancer of split-related protein HELT n=1 Tax=Fukomys damarensis TaxID=885580 RepID=UPI0014552DA8|nr:hairy and enhancer of split-related protein HELT [Fukomys damarensis]
MSDKLKDRKRTPVSHKVIEKRRRDRINRCLNELGKTVPMALAKQSSGKLEKAEILEMTVQYLRALHSADFPRGREKAELLAEFANYFHYGYHECMKNLVHYLTTVERMETKDTKYARILAFLQSKARLGAEPGFSPLASLPEPDFSYQLHSAGPEFPGHSPNEAAVFPQGAAPGPLPWPRKVDFFVMFRSSTTHPLLGAEGARLTGDQERRSSATWLGRGGRVVSRSLEP